MSDTPVKTYVECSAYDHLIQFESWEDGDCFITLWNPGSSKQWGRFHWAWRSLRGRWAGGTEIVLNREDVGVLVDALISHLNRTAP